MKKCPFCAELLPAELVTCPRCSRVLVPAGNVKRQTAPVDGESFVHALKMGLLFVLLIALPFLLKYLIKYFV